MIQVKSHTAKKLEATTQPYDYTVEVFGRENSVWTKEIEHKPSNENKIEIQWQQELLWINHWQSSNTIRSIPRIFKSFLLEVVFILRERLSDGKGNYWIQ